MRVALNLAVPRDPVATAVRPLPELLPKLPDEPSDETSDEVDEGRQAGVREVHGAPGHDAAGGVAETGFPTRGVAAAAWTRAARDLSSRQARYIALKPIAEPG